MRTLASLCHRQLSLAAAAAVCCACVQYWFPLADVLAWMGEALPPASQLTGSSPAAADTTSTPRRVTRHAAAAAAAAESSDRQQQRAEQGNEQQAGRAYASAAAAATAAEVSDVSPWQQQQSQSLSRRQRMQRLQRAAGSDKTRNEALLAAGLLVALLVMVAAVWLARRPVHELGPGYDAPQTSDVRQLLQDRLLVV